MFYQEKIDKVLRFGDVLRGYISTNPTIKEPILSLQDEGLNYKIDIEMPVYSVVLTPCCEIGDSVISLTPLVKVRGSFFKNPYFLEDLTRINRKMEPEQAYPPDEWEKMPPDEKQKRSEEGMGYASLECFIYEGNERFKKYTLREREIRYYMINFKNVYRIKCEKIKRPEKTKPEDASIMESKCLQLSVQTRAELRDKIAYYYSREPQEDKILLAD